MRSLDKNGWTATVIGGIIATVIGALIVAHFFTTPAPVASIAGPTTVVYGQVFELNADVGTAYKTAFWTDTFGRTVYITGGGSYSNMSFGCPGLGQYTVYLTVVSSSGATAQTSHNVDCVQ
jgi:hypothetical protein